jgi:hypothetical protein
MRAHTSQANTQKDQKITAALPNKQALRSVIQRRRRGRAPPMALRQQGIFRPARNKRILA